MQGKSRKTPTYNQVLAHFLKKRGIRSAIVPASFPLGYARELWATKIRVQPTNGSFWPNRETKSADEIRITGNLTASLAASRNGGGNGRIYTITIRCSDSSGNSSTATTTVTVPKGK